TRRFGVKLSGGLLAFLATFVAFAYCGWYEILELWDEYFWSKFERIHWWYDTPNDLFYDFLGVIAFIGAATFLSSINERFAKQPARELVPVGLRNLVKNMP